MALRGLCAAGRNLTLCAQFAKLNIFQTDSKSAVDL